MLLNSVQAAVGLVLFGFGVYLTIQADLGTGPWDVLTIGIANKLGVEYGVISIAISFAVVLVDILLREPIGIGMILDAIIVGKTVDLCNFLHLVPKSESIVLSVVILLLGLLIEGFSQFIYMRAALGCGPRDTLIVALDKRTGRFPIGAVVICIHIVVTTLGWLLGGPVGIGTILCAALTGPTMQLAFRVCRFNASAVVHQHIIASFKVLFRQK